MAVGLRPRLRQLGHPAILLGVSLMGILWPAIDATVAGAEADLSIIVGHDPEPVVGLQVLHYVARVHNAGPDTANSIKVVNVLPQGASFGSAGGIGWVCSSPDIGGVLTCTLTNLASGADAEVLGFWLLTPPRGGTLTDVASVTSDESDPVSANNSATEGVSVGPTPPLSFFTVTPCRIWDTRESYGGGPLGANRTRLIDRSWACGVPSEARALAINVTVLGASDPGDLKVYGAWFDEPNTSTINFARFQVRANSAVIPTPVYPSLVVQCDMAVPPSSGSVHFILDVTGYFE